MTILEAQSRVGGRVKTFREGFSDGLHAEGKVNVMHSFLGLLFGHQVRYSEVNSIKDSEGSDQTSLLQRLTIESLVHPL